jgi:lipid II:glycine glycyltransferase (peptidoglycan interpeptide bridge formation enzyme)
LFDYRDIYFTPQYCKIYENNGDGILKNFSMNSRYGKVYYNFLIREIDWVIDNKRYYDITTPYGYGGPLFYDYETDEDLKNLILEFKEEFEEYCQENDIVSEFIRFHPLIKNYLFMDNYMEISHIRDTVYIKLDSEKQIWHDMESTCRNKVRKAEKNNVYIELNNSEESLQTFIKLYNRTMVKNNAISYYFFKDKFFYDTMELLKGNIYIFNAVYDSKIISSALIMKYNEFAHYHFSGADPEYLKLAPNNLLLYKVALWAYENGCKYFHLGGGYLGNNDSLFEFKKSFSKNNLLKFYIGKKIHNKEIYIKLTEEWEKVNNNKEKKNNFFPIYRA